jgi:hypothetical protein
VNVQRIPTARRKSHQDEFCVRVQPAHGGGEICKVIVEFAGIVDVAPRAGGAMAADVGRVDRDAFGGQCLAERLDAHALR